MTLSKITFVKSSAGLGKPLAGKDHYSGMVFYNNTLPSGFSTSSRIKQIFSVSEAETLGINTLGIDETQSTGNYLVTGIGADGDTLQLSVTVPNKGVIALGTYTKVTSDTTVTLVAVAYRAIVNLGTITHGYVATGAGANVLLTPPKGTGIKLNTGTPLASAVVGTIGGTITQFSGGVGSLVSAYHYHISEYFRMQPKGVLWIGIFSVPAGSYDFAELVTMQTFAMGDIRQIAVYLTNTAFATSQVSAIQAQCTILEGLNTSLQAVFGAEISATSLLSSLPALNTLTCKNVSVAIGQDAGNVGYDLFLQIGKSIGTIGATLGTISLSNVSNSIAWVGQFNIGLGNELDVLGFANGVTYLNTTNAQLDVLDNQSYIFLKKQIGIDGSYFNSEYTAIIQSNDFSTIQNNRTIDKAIREVRSQLLPRLNSPILANADGTLTEDVIADFKTLAKRPLDQIQSDGDLSDSLVIINPAQNVVSTSTLTISLQLLPVGVAKNINVNIGFTTKLG